MVAAYLFHIIQNHPFVDGNKRAGAMAAYVFLAANHQELDADEAEFEALCLGVSWCGLGFNWQTTGGRLFSTPCQRVAIKRENSGHCAKNAHDSDP